jgi:hypothetical protein
MPSTAILRRLFLASAGLLLSVAAPAATTVDLFIAYTPAARAYAGGVNGMVAAINSYVALTNTCYVNSDIAITLRLVGTAEVNYTETGSFNTDLTRLQNLGDGYIDEIGTLRDAYGADLVALIRRDAAAGVAGLAYVGNASPGFAPYAYSVTADVWASGNLAFPHELGHNYGALHDRQNSSGSTYAYGWRFYGNNGVQYITVMAYYPGTRIPYFSNPSVLYQGQPTGVALPAANAADNALLHENNAAGTAAFRAATAPTGSGVRGDFTGDGKPDLVLWNAATGARSLWTMNGTSRAAISALPSGSSAWQIMTTADFNADGHADLIFQNFTTGGRTIWLMNGPARQSIVELPVGLTTWRIGTAADFNADGQVDLIFHNTADGRRSLWLMNGTTRVSVVDLPTGIPSWHIAASGDFNADGKPDILFQNVADGRRSLWLMDGITRQSVVDFTPGLVSWRIVGAQDMNSDGQTDILFENTADGRRSLWLMNGVTRVSVVDLPTTDAAWKISNH